MNGKGERSTAWWSIRLDEEHSGERAPGYRKGGIQEPTDHAYSFTPFHSRGGRGSGACVTLVPLEAGRGTQVMGTSHRGPPLLPTTSPNNWHPGGHIRGDGELHRLGQGTSFNFQGSKTASACNFKLRSRMATEAGLELKLVSLHSKSVILSSWFQFRTKQGSRHSCWGRCCGPAG